MLLRGSARWLLIVGLAIPFCAPALSSAPALQSAVSRAMAGQSGTTVVLDVRSGQVLASYRLDLAARRLAFPGSSIKPFTLMALLDAGTLDAGTALMCKRSVSIAGHKLDCTHPDTKQPLNPAEALAYSCNYYFTTVALRLTPARLRDSFVRDGFTSLTGLAPNEAAGGILLAQSPEQEQLEAIGEWGVKVTPLELARAYRQIAILEPRHDERLAPLFYGLQESVAFGMGRMAQPATSMKVSGKTGTAPSDEGSWTHAWFAGYAPAENPEIVVVVFLEKGRGGSDAAAVARSIFAAFAQSRSAQQAERKAGGRP
jgi:peptidoglycan glycosyltransferase